MCGISGIVGAGGNKSKITSMVDTLHHRGPDDNGYYINKDKSVGLGHNRLSIIDLSKDGHQPMSNNDKTCWITFNGEIYNYSELKKQLSNYTFKSKTDTEVIIAAYERWGEKCVNYFNGMFAFAIWDEKKKKLFCARDRVGIKPFYYTKNGDSFMFASEIKALLSAGCVAKPNWKIWSEYLLNGLYDHSNETFFDNIFSLDPGHTLTLEDGTLSINQYWDLDKIELYNEKLPESHYCEKFNYLFTDSIKLRLRSDVPVGVNLSGGLDSASLMVTLDKLINDKSTINAFTATYGDPKYDEHIFAEKLNTKAKWNLNICKLDLLKVWSSLENIIWHQEAPFGGIATVAYHNLHQLAQKEGITVLLEGQGADEMLAGYKYFQDDYLLDQDNMKNKGYNNKSNKKQFITSPIYQDGSTFLTPNCVSKEIHRYLTQVNNFNKPFTTHLSNALYRDFKFTKLPRVLRMNDHLSMAFGRELREPYLDHRIVEYLFSLPSHLKIKNGQTKYLLRKAMVDHLPNTIRYAKKRPIVTPQREWLGDNLKINVLDLIHSQSFAERGIFNYKKVKKQYLNYCSIPAENSFFIWQWINTELWFQKFIDL